MVKISTLCVFLIVRLRTQSCEVFSAVASMEQLLKTQAHLIETLSVYPQSVYNRERRIIKALISKMKKEHAISQSNPEHYLGNPINAFTLIMRLFRDLMYVEKFHNKTGSYIRNESLVYPQKADAVGATDAIIRLYLMYDLNIPQLANGTLITNVSKSKRQYVEFVTPMTANDCFDLGKINHEAEDRTSNVLWLKAAYDKYKTDKYLCQFTEKDLVTKIAGQYYIMKDWKNTIVWLEKRLALNADDLGALNALEHTKQKLYNKERNETNRRMQKPKKILQAQFCRDEFYSMQTSRKHRYVKREVRRLAKLDPHFLFQIEGAFSLTCYYAHGPHPYLKLAPIKAEQLHDDPDVTLFYDVITDAEARAIKNKAKPTLSRGTVYYEESGVSRKSDIRTSHNTAIPEDTPELAKVLLRVRQFTGLQWNIHTTEPCQIANYGIGGHYFSHSDVPPGTFRNDTTCGRRIATVLFYLSDVEQGGATIFRYLELTVFPVRNAALLWHNLDPWGDNRAELIHAACPVLRGSKWILTKWINIAGQEFIRPCPVDPPGRDVEHLGKERKT